MAACFDVAVVGGGPGGGALALSLRDHAPGLSLGLVEASGYDAPRLGETLPPPAARLLEHLGVWDAFAAQGHAPVYGTAAAWGAASLHEHDFLYAPRSVGWHLDRRAFDAMLVDEAESRGAVIARRTRLARAERTAGGWRLHLSPGETWHARFLVDATGAAAVVAHACGARSRRYDRLAGFARFFRDAPGADPRTLIEAFADGWWYTAPLPGGLRVAACMTDSDIARHLRLGDAGAWSRLLGTTDRVAPVLRDAAPCGPALVRATPSRRLDPAAGAGWLAVGDAAATYDPLSSQGIAKALRSGIFASYAIADLLVRGDETGLHRYQRLVQDDFEAYARLRTHYYAAEQRWPEHPFWQRRQSP